MRESLQSLETARADILAQMARLGDLRAGSVTTTQGRCGKANCSCHQPGHPGHGPHVRLTYKVEGKTQTEALSSPMAVRKVEQEIAEFRKFQQLSREFIAVNARICRLQPAGQERSGEEKKRSKRSRGKWRKK